MKLYLIGVHDMSIDRSRRLTIDLPVQQGRPSSPFRHVGECGQARELGQGFGTQPCGRPGIPDPGSKQLLKSSLVHECM